jgi:hypothetical protein
MRVELLVKTNATFHSYGVSFSWRRLLQTFHSYGVRQRGRTANMVEVRLEEGAQLYTSKYI